MREKEPFKSSAQIFGFGQRIAEKAGSVRPSAGDHPAVQSLDPLAGGALAKTRNKGMEETGTARQKKRTCKGKGHALMLEIVFADRLRMTEKQTRKHGKDPVRCLDNIGHFPSKLFPFTVAIRLIRGILYHDWQT
jgi:hypothetical protein